MLGKGEPRILEWEVKTAPFTGIATMRFFAGTAEGPRGPEEVEQMAVVDLQASTVIAVETYRRGDKVAKTTWDDGKLVVASADGTNDEFQLRQGRPKETASPPPTKRYASEHRNPSPWGPWGGGGGGRKPKTIFDLLFGN
jgi:hypothetical protein